MIGLRLIKVIDIIIFMLIGEQNVNLISSLTTCTFLRIIWLIKFIIISMKRTIKNSFMPI